MPIVFFCCYAMSLRRAAPAPPARRASVLLFRTLAALAEAALALLLGMAIVDYIPYNLSLIHI